MRSLDLSKSEIGYNLINVALYIRNLLDKFTAHFCQLQITVDSASNVYINRESVAFKVHQEGTM